MYFPLVHKTIDDKKRIWVKIKVGWGRRFFLLEWFLFTLEDPEVYPFHHLFSTHALQLGYKAYKNTVKRNEIITMLKQKQVQNNYEEYLSFASITPPSIPLGRCCFL